MHKTLVLCSNSKSDSGTCNEHLESSWSLDLIKSINIDEFSNFRIFENLNHDKRSSLENLPASIFPGFDL